jgi:hypothetical protein
MGIGGAARRDRKPTAASAGCSTRSSSRHARLHGRLLTADREGAGKSTANDTRSREIPWVIAGPGICRNLDLTLFGSSTSDRRHVRDRLLAAGIRVSKPIDGHPVTESLKGLEVAIGRTAAMIDPKSSYRQIDPRPPALGRWAEPFEDDVTVVLVRQPRDANSDGLVQIPLS